METNKNSDIAISNPTTSITNFTDSQLELIVEAAATTGVKSKGEALMIFQKARELGIGAGNAISHLHIVNGKSGIDIHIVKAILSRPSAGITWVQDKDFEPVYAAYSDGIIQYTYDTLPPNYIVLPKLSGNPIVEELKTQGKHPVAVLPTGKGNTLEVIDRISQYSFERIKRNIKGDWITVKTTSSFRWSDAIKAQLPLDKAGQLNPNSNWQKYSSLMLAIRAFTYGARDIASDLLLGAYETTELYEFSNIDYNINDEGHTEIIDATVTD